MCQGDIFEINHSNMYMSKLAVIVRQIKIANMPVNEIWYMFWLEYLSVNIKASKVWIESSILIIHLQLCQYKT